MKTPWKFLVELSSRRLPAKVQENQIADDADPEGLENEAEDTPALPSDNPTEASSTPDHDAGGSVDQMSMVWHSIDLPIDTEEAQTLAPSPQESTAEAGAAGLKSETSAKSPSKLRIERRERPKRARAQVVAQSAVATNDAQSEKPASSGDTFFNEVAILDEEIKELRRLLARKLYLQNVQLRKMLERFDGS
ncbi:hypothetical protein [Sinorhizobium sp. CCBAU 05631]|uniref:hypothetical protein n=1 Tax=Sinorhizobium sp. CCBAU 05631 TaxID=794846 RepID=UPI00056069C1|nr:hypothetical protein [Sinorhizobium sp. CCBAU 05631]